MVKDLEEQGLLVKVKPHTHNVGTHDRCGTVVEPIVSRQWYVKMADLAKPAIDVVRNGKRNGVQRYLCRNCKKSVCSRKI